MYGFSRYISSNNNSSIYNSISLEQSNATINVRYISRNKRHGGST